MRFPLPRRWFTLAAVALAACHESTGPGAPSLQFAGAANARDTIGARIAQALVVTVRDAAGAVPPAGTVVQFAAVVSPAFRGEALVKPVNGAAFTGLATSPTDDGGQASMLIVLGTMAGTARVVVSVPTLGVVDTARFTVMPGNAYGPLVTPADTALYAGKSFTLRSGIVDRAGNPRPDPATWSAPDAGVTVTGAGVATAGTVIGRYRIIATGMGMADTGAVSVVPPGRLAAWSGALGTGTLTTVDVDGSNETALATVNNGGIGIHPAWIPGTSSVVYTTLTGNVHTLYVVGPGAAPKPFFAAAPPTVTDQAEPTPSADGKWLYFSAYDTRCAANDYCVLRARVDGSAPELLVATPSRNPAPSPDGSRVAYYDNTRIRVLDVATKTTSSWSVAGYQPAWSPDGSQIAFLDPSGAISLVAPDGTGARVLSPAVVSISGPTWSPDGKWLLARPNTGKAALVDPVTGATLPLGYFGTRLPASMK
jgi:hypothetical protein